jgi:hypothetical protein
MASTDSKTPFPATDEKRGFVFSGTGVDKFWPTHPTGNQQTRSRHPNMKKIVKHENFL